MSRHLPAQRHLFGAVHNHDENPTLSMERDMELLEHLDRLNYHEAWIGEHHSGGSSCSPAPRCSSPPRRSARGISGLAPASSRCLPQPFMVADRMVTRPHDARTVDVRGRPGALVHDALKIGVDPVTSAG